MAVKRLYEGQSNGAKKYISLAFHELSKNTSKIDRKEEKKIFKN